MNRPENRKFGFLRTAVVAAGVAMMFASSAVLAAPNPDPAKNKNAPGPTPETAAQAAAKSNAAAAKLAGKWTVKWPNNSKNVMTLTHNGNSTFYGNYINDAQQYCTDVVGSFTYPKTLNVRVVCPARIYNFKQTVSADFKSAQGTFKESSVDSMGTEGATLGTGVISMTKQ